MCVMYKCLKWEKNLDNAPIMDIDILIDEK